ncbi:hypothetical protein A1D23_10595 [Chelonobacter oris]|nr:hypothetical protein [Chelonobacter oris]
MLPALSQAELADNGLLTVTSRYDAPETVQRIEQAVTDKGMTVFGIIDHQKAAQENELTMPAATVILFGNPKAGTPIMLASPTMALDLPLKALIWEDQQGTVFVSLNKAAFLGQRHGVAQDIVRKLAGAETLIPNAVK